MTQPIIYTIPGLGFDHRIFQKIKFPAQEVHHLNWIEPGKNEPIKNYARRFSKNIKGENVILIGHSFGGMMAQEIAQIIPVKKIILISSIKSQKEKPLNFKMVAPIGLHRFFTKSMTFKTFDYWGKNFGYNTETLQSMFKKMVGLQSDQYLQWALFNLSKWEGVENLNTPIFHIHGTQDKTFPIKNIKEPFIKINNGTHMMVYNKAKVIADILRKLEG